MGSEMCIRDRPRRRRHAEQRHADARHTGAGESPFAADPTQTDTRTRRAETCTAETRRQTRRRALLEAVPPPRSWFMGMFVRHFLFWLFFFVQPAVQNDCSQKAAERGSAQLVRCRPNGMSGASETVPTKINLTKCLLCHEKPCTMALRPCGPCAPICMRAFAYQRCPLSDLSLIHI